MNPSCPKCGGAMDDGRIPIPLKYLFGYKSSDQKHLTMESNVDKARACVDCGYLELYVNPDEIRKKRKD